MFSGSDFNDDSEFCISFATKVDLGGDKVQVPQEGQGQKIIFFSESAPKYVLEFIFGLKKNFFFFCDFFFA